MIYVLAGLSVVLALTNVYTIRWAFSAIENTNLLGAQERDNLSANHATQLSEFANRIQVPARAAQMSISTLAPESDPFVHPDFVEEQEIAGVTVG